MKKGNLIELPAKPVTDDNKILWTFAVGSAFPKEALTIELRVEGDISFWRIYIRARNFAEAEDLRECACRRLGLRASDGFRKEERAGVMV